MDKVSDYNSLFNFQLDVFKLRSSLIIIDPRRNPIPMNKMVVMVVIILVFITKEVVNPSLTAYTNTHGHSDLSAI